MPKPKTEKKAIRFTADKDEIRMIDELCNNYGMNVSDLMRVIIRNEYDSFKWGSKGYEEDE